MLQDRIGHKSALGSTIVGWIVTCRSSPRFSTTTGEFWVAAEPRRPVHGIEPVRRARARRPVRAAAQLAEFFGLWGFAIRLASIIGPLTYGAITWATGGNHRAGHPVDRRACSRSAWRCC